LVLDGGYATSISPVDGARNSEVLKFSFSIFDGVEGLNGVILVGLHRFLKGQEIFIFFRSPIGELVVASGVGVFRIGGVHKFDERVHFVPCAHSVFKLLHGLVVLAEFCNEFHEFEFFL